MLRQFTILRQSQQGYAVVKMDTSRDAEYRRLIVALEGTSSPSERKHLIDDITRLDMPIAPKPKTIITKMETKIETPKSKEGFRARFLKLIKKKQKA
jgi:hypothetical protein